MLLIIFDRSIDVNVKRRQYNILSNRTINEYERGTYEGREIKRVIIIGLYKIIFKPPKNIRSR